MSNEIKDWVLVPREPTEAMRTAASEWCQTPVWTYRAMIAAAPRPPAQPQAWRILWSPDFPETCELTADGARVGQVQGLANPPRIQPLYATPPEAQVVGGGAVRDALARAIGCGYAAGHNDTVEGIYSDVSYADSPEHHGDLADELLQDSDFAAIAALSAQPRQDDRCICEGVGWSNPQDHLPNCPHTAEVSTSSQPQPASAPVDEEMVERACEAYYDEAEAFTDRPAMRAALTAALAQPQGADHD